MGLCIIVLQHEVMAEDEWHGNESQDVVMLSLCIHTAVNKMHLMLARNITHHEALCSQH